MNQEITPKFIRERITDLRIEKHVSEYLMSYDLGHSRGYVNNISSGKSLPSMKEFLSICEYFGITPEDFFRQEQRYPVTIQEIVRCLESLSKEELEMVLKLVKMLAKSEDG